MLAKRVPEFRPSNPQNPRVFGGELCSGFDHETKASLPAENHAPLASSLFQKPHHQFPKQVESCRISLPIRTEKQGIASILSDEDLIECKLAFQKRVELILETEEVPLVSSDFSAQLCMIHYLISKSFDLEILARSSPFTLVLKEVNTFKLFSSLDELLKVTGEFMKSAGQLTCKKYKWLAETNALLISKLLGNSTQDTQQNRNQITAICHLLTSFYQNLKVSLQIANYSPNKLQDEFVLSKDNLRLAEKTVETILKWVLAFKQTECLDQSESSETESNLSDENPGSEVQFPSNYDYAKSASLNIINSLIKRTDEEVLNAPKSKKDFCIGVSPRQKFIVEIPEPADSKPNPKPGQLQNRDSDQLLQRKSRRRIPVEKNQLKPQSLSAFIRQPVESERKETNLQPSQKPASANLGKGFKAPTPRSVQKQPIPRTEAEAVLKCTTPKGPSGSGSCKKISVVSVERPDSGPASGAQSSEKQRSAAQRIFDN